MTGRNMPRIDRPRWGLGSDGSSATAHEPRPLSLAPPAPSRRVGSPTRAAPPDVPASTRKPHTNRKKMVTDPFTRDTRCQTNHAVCDSIVMDSDSSLLGESKAASATLLGMQLQQLVLLRSNISREAEEWTRRTRSEMLRLWRLTAEAEDAAAELELRRTAFSELVEIHCGIVDARAKLLSLEHLLLSSTRDCATEEPRIGAPIAPLPPHNCLGDGDTLERLQVLVARALVVSEL